MSLAEYERAGSSPRVRGKRAGHGGCDDLDGLIPARAGKTWANAGKELPFEAHPRACGENEWVNGRGQVRTGSSPRVRGKQLPAA